MPSAEIKRHWTRVAELGCIITHRPNPTLHHARGGSLVPLIGLTSLNEKTSDWLVLPLDAEYHTGDQGIDVIGVRTWESEWGRQVDLLDYLSLRIGYNVWRKAGIERDVWVEIPRGGLPIVLA